MEALKRVYVHKQEEKNSVKGVMRPMTFALQEALAGLPFRQR